MSDGNKYPQQPYENFPLEWHQSILTINRSQQKLKKKVKNTTGISMAAKFYLKM